MTAPAAHLGARPLGIYELQDVLDEVAPQKLSAYPISVKAVLMARGWLERGDSRGHVVPPRGWSWEHRAGELGPRVRTLLALAPPDAIVQVVLEALPPPDEKP